MKTKLFLTAIIMVMSVFGYSQSTQNHHKVYIPFWIGAGYGYEWSVADEVTINSQIDMRAYIGDDDFAIDNFVFSPRITIEPRYYYNLKKRAEKGKNINSNSANYVSFDLSYELPLGLSGIRDVPQHTFRLLPSWGMRRELSEHFTMDFSVYAGYKLIGTQYYNDSNCYIDGGTTCDPWKTKFDDGKFVFGVNLIFSHIF